MHMDWEMDGWLEKYVKNGGAKPDGLIHESSFTMYDDSCFIFK